MLKAERTKYMFMSHEENAAKNHNIKKGNKSFENVHSSKSQQQPHLIKLAFTKKLREDVSQAMLAIFQCRILVFQHAIQKFKD